MSIRLIDTETLELRSFVGSSVPKYAVLSHTWGPESDEVTLQDMLAINRGSKNLKKGRSGYRKIVETCRKAKLAGYEYCWVDTCCIDKTSSAELSEAINSMFRWYRDAAVCYVLFSDFEIGDTRDMAPIRKCRWFKRGWCLQELVAPWHVEFFDRLWNFLGSREGLSSQISKITAIATEVLDGKVSMETLPIAQRLAWAAKRETTRAEDIAYCLLGIFDIQMPILYGEGTKAFIRLQEEIIKQSNDRSIFASQLPGGTDRYCDMLAPSPDYFAHCANLVHTKDDQYHGSAYALTNRGLQFSEARLFIDYESGVYVLPLFCMLSRSLGQTEVLPIQLVGPNLFARCNQYFDTEVFDEVFARWQSLLTIAKRNIYTISHITASIQADLLLADEYSIQVSSDTLALKGRHALQIVEGSVNSENWDVARMQFVTRGRPVFEGYWKLYPARALRSDDEKLAANFTVNYCYVFCGLRSGQSGRMPEPWVIILSHTEWLDFEKRYGTYTNHPSDVLSIGQEKRSSSRLDIGRNRFTRLYLDVSMDTDTQQRIYRLKINFIQGR